MYSAVSHPSMLSWLCPPRKDKWECWCASSKSTQPRAWLVREVAALGGKITQERASLHRRPHLLRSAPSSRRSRVPLVREGVTAPYSLTTLSKDTFSRMGARRELPCDVCTLGVCRWTGVSERFRCKTGFDLEGTLCADPNFVVERAKANVLCLRYASQCIPSLPLTRLLPRAGVDNRDAWVERRPLRRLDTRTQAAAQTQCGLRAARPSADCNAMRDSQINIHRTMG